MRLIGLAERALELMCRRTLSRVAFGKPIARAGRDASSASPSRASLIEQARLLTLKAAHMMDTVGNKAPQAEIAMIKVAAPQHGVQGDRLGDPGATAAAAPTTTSASRSAYATARMLRLADGPDEVHRNQIAKLELAKYR